MTGGPDGWRDWLNQHGAALVLLAKQWVPGHADAEDVVQEAFVRFWKSRQRVADPAAYLYACVRHGALDWRRGQSRRCQREAAAARSEVERWFTGPLDEQERRATLEAALLQLPENQREVLVMKIWGGLSFPQIAAALDISPNTAASRYRYALGKLREQLAEESVP